MQHQAWKPETDAFFNDAGFPALNKIADFGCGPGFTACDIAKEISPHAEVCGFDVSEMYLQHLNGRVATEHISNLRTIQANLTEPVDVGSDFDGAFCRWFLAWVARDLDSVLSNIFNSLKPGGMFASMEYLTLKSTVSSPPDPTFSVMVKAWEEFYLQCGATTEIGSTLPDALKKAGFTIKELKCVGGLAPNGHRWFQWWKRLNEDFNEIFREKNLLSTDQISRLEKFWATNAENPNAFIHTPIIMQITAVKPN